MLLDVSHSGHPEPVKALERAVYQQSPLASFLTVGSIFIVRLSCLQQRARFFGLSLAFLIAHELVKEHRPLWHALLLLFFTFAFAFARRHQPLLGVKGQQPGTGFRRSILWSSTSLTSSSTVRRSGLLSLVALKVHPAPPLPDVPKH